MEVEDTMKRMIAMMMMAGCSLMAADLRTVSGIAVDVEPAVTWERAEGKKGERPLPHWKMVTVLAYAGPANGGHVALVSIKGLGEREVLLTGVAQDLVQKMTRHRDIGWALGNAKAAKAGAEHAERATQGLSTGGFAMGSAGYVQSVAAQWQRNRNMQAMAAANAGLVRESIERLTEMKHAAELDLIGATDVAMWTGREIAGRQLWTFGKR